MTATSIDHDKELQELDEFIESSKKKLTSILTRLGWSLESVTKDVKRFVVCPFNEAHRVPEQSLDRHLQACQWKAEGYGEKDLPLSVPTLPPGAPSSIKFDEQLQDKVIQEAKQRNPTMAIGVGGRLIPRTSDRLTADFTREERCAMYEYVIANTVEPDIGDDIADMNKPKSSSDGKTSSYLELLAQERNLKRRRAKYRGVHTNKKSQVEILREVVNQQMEMLVEYIAERRGETSGNPVISASDGNNYESSRHDRVVEDKSFSGDADNVYLRGNNAKEFPRDRGGSCENRRYDRKSDGSHREYHKPRERSPETEKTPRHRRDSSERRSHKSSRHKRHKHKSHDRRGRSGSREREKSRSSKDRREHDVRRSESSRHSHCEDRRKKKRRSRSR